MKRTFSFDKMFEVNKLVLICVVFSVLIVFVAIGGAITGDVTNIDFEFVVWNLAYISAPILSISIIQYLWKLDYITDKGFLFWAAIPLHYLFSFGLILSLTFVRSFFVDLPQGIYLFRFRDFTAIYVIIVIGGIVIDILHTATDNKNLRKIQASLSSANNTNKN